RRKGDLRRSAAGGVGQGAEDAAGGDGVPAAGVVRVLHPEEAVSGSMPGQHPVGEVVEHEILRRGPQDQHGVMVAAPVEDGRDEQGPGRNAGLNEPLLLRQSEVLAIAAAGRGKVPEVVAAILAQVRHLADRKSTRLNSSHVKISYAVFCLKK